MSFFEVMTALMPVLAVFLFLVIFRFPAVIAMPISFGKMLFYVTMAGIIGFLFVYI